MPLSPELDDPLGLQAQTRPARGASSRARVLAAVQADPGIHVSQLAVRTGLSWHTARYHLGVLEGHGLVQLEKEGRERRAFPAGLPPTHRGWMAVLREGGAAEVLQSIQQDPGQSIPGLSRRMGSSEKVLRRHITNLAQAGLLDRRGQLRPVYEVSPAAEPALAERLRRR